MPRLVIGGGAGAMARSDHDCPIGRQEGQELPIEAADVASEASMRVMRRRHPTPRPSSA